MNNPLQKEVYAFPFVVVNLSRTIYHICVGKRKTLCQIENCGQISGWDYYLKEPKYYRLCRNCLKIQQADLFTPVQAAPPDALDTFQPSGKANLLSTYYLEYSMSQFNPDTFLDAQVTEPSTKRPPLPAGADFVATIGEVKSRAWQGKTDPTKSGIAIDVPVEIDLTAYPEQMAALGGLTKVVLQDSIMLDTTPQGGIDNGPGKNAKLRRYREALNMNNPGDVFSFRAMQGRMLKVKIKHETYEGEIYDKVDSIARAG